MLFHADEKEETSEPTLQELYLSICRRLRVVPVSYFLRHVDDSDVDIKYHGIIAAETAAIAKALKVCLLLFSLLIIVTNLYFN